MSDLSRKSDSTDKPAVIKPLCDDAQKTIQSGYSMSSVAQCVGELVLNALDANAKNIAVRVNTNTFRIQVVDDGDGILSSNLTDAGKRNYTNRMLSITDLETVRKPFGYKGEALAAIATVSRRTRIVTRPSSSTTTTYFKVIEDDNHVVGTTTERPSRGTTVTVEGFMNNLPVRQKCTKRSEINDIKTYLQRLAIFHFDVTFTLRDETNKNMLFTSKVAKTVEEAVGLQYDHLSLDRLRFSAAKKGRSKILALTYLELYEYAKCQQIFVNKRPVRYPRLVEFVNEKLANSLIYAKRKKAENLFYIINIACPISKFNFVDYNEVYYNEEQSLAKIMDDLLTRMLRKEKLLIIKPTKKCVDLKLHQYRLSGLPGAFKATATRNNNDMDVAQGIEQVDETERADIPNANQKKDCVMQEFLKELRGVSNNNDDWVFEECMMKEREPSPLPDFVSHENHSIQPPKQENKKEQSVFKNPTESDNKTVVGKNYILERYLQGQQTNKAQALTSSQPSLRFTSDDHHNGISMKKFRSADASEFPICQCSNADRQRDAHPSKTKKRTNENENEYEMDMRAHKIFKKQEKKKAKIAKALKMHNITLDPRTKTFKKIQKIDIETATINYNGGTPMKKFQSADFTDFPIRQCNHESRRRDAHSSKTKKSANEIDNKYELDIKAHKKCKKGKKKCTKKAIRKSMKKCMKKSMKELKKHDITLDPCTKIFKKIQKSDIETATINPNDITFKLPHIPHRNRHYKDERVEAAVKDMNDLTLDPCSKKFKEIQHVQAENFFKFTDQVPKDIENEYIDSSKFPDLHHKMSYDCAPISPEFFQDFPMIQQNRFGDNNLQQKPEAKQTTIFDNPFSSRRNYFQSNSPLLKDCFEDIPLASTSSDYIFNQVRNEMAADCKSKGKENFDENLQAAWEKQGSKHRSRRSEFENNLDFFNEPKTANDFPLAVESSSSHSLLNEIDFERNQRRLHRRRRLFKELQSFSKDHYKKRQEVTSRRHHRVANNEPRHVSPEFIRQRSPPCRQQIADSDDIYRSPLLRSTETSDQVFPPHLGNYEFFRKEASVIHQRDKIRGVLKNNLEYEAMTIKTESVVTKCTLFRVKPHKANIEKFNVSPPTRDTKCMDRGTDPGTPPIGPENKFIDKSAQWETLSDEELMIDQDEKASQEYPTSEHSYSVQVPTKQLPKILQNIKIVSERVEMIKNEESIVVTSQKSPTLELSSENIFGRYVASAASGDQDKTFKPFCIRPDSNTEADEDTTLKPIFCIPSNSEFDANKTHEPSACIPTHSEEQNKMETNSQNDTANNIMATMSQPRKGIQFGDKTNIDYNSPITQSFFNAALTSQSTESSIFMKSPYHQSDVIVIETESECSRDSPIIRTGVFEKLKSKQKLFAIQATTKQSENIDGIESINKENDDSEVNKSVNNKNITPSQIFDYSVPTTLPTKPKTTPDIKQIIEIDDNEVEIAEEEEFPDQKLLTNKAGEVRVWQKNIDDKGRCYYIDMRTGNTMKKTVESPLFALSERPQHLPRGFSQSLVAAPVITGEVSSEIKREFFEAVVKCYDEDESYVKWQKIFLQQTDPEKFFSNIYDKELVVESLNNLKLPMFKTPFGKMNLSKEMLGELEVINQYDSKFIIAVWKRRCLIVIFDQHAVHERIRLEELSKSYKNEDGCGFTHVDLPIFTLMLNENILHNCQENSQVFKRFGLSFAVDAHSDNEGGALKISSIPLCLHTKVMKESQRCQKLAELTKALIFEISEKINDAEIDSRWTPRLLIDLINSEACRGAIMFGDKLTIPECQDLIANLAQCKNPFQCAHGRPTCAPLLQYEHTEMSRKVNLAALKRYKKRNNF